MKLSDDIVEGLQRHEDPVSLAKYKAHWKEINSQLDGIASSLATLIRKKGYLAHPISASGYLDEKKLIGAIPHTLVANLAGLGWKGKSYLLVTPRHGPRVRLATVLTDAPLPTGSLVEQKYGSCTRCVEICPIGAFANAQFDSFGSREKRFNIRACSDYMARRKENLGEGLCGLCVYVCPRGRPQSLTNDENP